MIDTTKFYEYFQPEQVKDRIHIIGCGSVGSTVAELLIRHGLTKLTLYDFDKVELKNLANQMFDLEDVGELKTAAVKRKLCAIDKGCEKDVVLKGRYEDQYVTGIVFLCVDSIELRQKIYEELAQMDKVKAVIDIRTGLTNASCYAFDTKDSKSQMFVAKHSNFTDEEANDATPMSACGEVLGVAGTVRLISALGVNNLIYYLKGNKLKKYIYIDCEKFELTSI